MNNVEAKELKPIADAMKQSQKEKGVIVLLSESDGKVSLLVGVTADLSAKVSAVDLVKLGAEALGGKGGGGRPDMAQAGGNDPSKMDAAIATIEDAVKKLAAA